MTCNSRSADFVLRRSLAPFRDDVGPWVVSMLRFRLLVPVALHIPSPVSLSADALRFSMLDRHPILVGLAAQVILWMELDVRVLLRRVGWSIDWDRQHNTR